jgi:type IV secretion system protein VirD4
MQNNKGSAGSQSVSLGQVFALFKGIQPSESFIKGFLYLIGIILTPVTLFGALAGYKRAYNRYGFPNRELPTLKNLTPITKISMFIGAIIAWISIALVFVVVGKVAGAFFGSRSGIQVVLIFIAINFSLSAAIFLSFKRWQRMTYMNMGELSRFGSARWAKLEDMADLERKSGLYIGGGIYGYAKQGHFLTQGGARGGKGVNCILPNLLGLSGYDGSWFIIDVKGELAAVSARFQRESGQDVLILDPWELNTKNGASYNPLDLVADQTNPDNLIDDISIIAEMIVPKEAKGEQFWDNKARSLIAGLILHLMTTEEKKKQTLAKIWHWLRLPTAEFEELLADMAVSDSAVVRATGNEYASIIHTSEKMFHSILAVAQEKTDFLKSPALQRSLSSSNFDVKNITNGKTTLYVIIPPDKLDSHYQWLRLVMTTALRSAVRNHDKRVTFLLDEFAALGYLPEIKVALSTYAGYNISMWPIVQDLGQLQSLYGQSWETFISNTAVRQFLSVSDMFSLEYLSKVMGTTTATTYDTNTGKPQTSARPLATPDEISRASADNIFVLVEQRPAAILSKLPYYNMPTLNGKHDPNPYYKS